MFAGIFFTKSSYFFYIKVKTIYKKRKRQIKNITDF